MKDNSKSQEGKITYNPLQLENENVINFKLTS